MSGAPIDRTDNPEAYMTNLGATAQPRYRYFAKLLGERLKTGAKVVEFGAAPGDQIAQLAKSGYQCTAVDIGLNSDEWADAEEGRMAKLLKEAGVDLVEWNLEEVPYPLNNGQFDAVVMTEVFEHLREYPITALEQAFRVLKPGGYFMFSTPNAAYLMKRVKLVGGRSTASSLHEWLNNPPHFRHSREYTFAEIHDLMKMAGFEVEISESHHFYRGDGSTLKRLVKSAIHRIGKLRPTLGPQIVIVARKPTIS